MSRTDLLPKPVNVQSKRGTAVEIMTAGITAVVVAPGATTISMEAVATVGLVVGAAGLVATLVTLTVLHLLSHCNSRNDR